MSPQDRLSQSLGTLGLEISPEIQAKLIQFLEILEDKSNYPVFFHCKNGRDRTGVMAALYYVKYEQLKREEAYNKSAEVFPPHSRWKAFGRAKFNLFYHQIAEDRFSVLEEITLDESGVETALLLEEK